jgi:hypothetical protein
MTKKEAIDFINKCNADGICGFMVVAVSKDDIENYCNDEFMKEFDKLEDSNKETVMSGIADELNDIYQDYNFADDMQRICDYFNEDIEMAFDNFIVE